jgi:hypothetical protein
VVLRVEGRLQHGRGRVAGQGEHHRKARRAKLLSALDEPADLVRVSMLNRTGTPQLLSFAG